MKKQLKAIQLKSSFRELNTSNYWCFKPKILILLLSIFISFTVNLNSQVTCNTVTETGCGTVATTFKEISSSSTISLSAIVGSGCLLSAVNAATTPQYIILNKNLLVDMDYTFASGSEIIVKVSSNGGFSLNTNIIIGSGKTLTAVNTTFTGCGNSWRGISVTGGYLRLLSCRIYDAEYGLATSNGSRLTVYNNEFKRCKYGIYFYDNSSVNHLIINNDFYGDETLNSPLSGKPLNAIYSENSGPVRFSGLHIFDYNSTASFTYPVYSKNSNMTISGIECINFRKAAVYALGTSGQSSIIIGGGEFDGYPSADGIVATGYDLTCTNLSITDCNNGIVFTPTTNQKVAINNCEFPVIFQKCILLNPSSTTSQYKQLNYSGYVINCDANMNNGGNSAFLTIYGRRGSNSLLVENNTIEDTDEGCILGVDCDNLNIVHNIMSGDGELSFVGIKFDGMPKLVNIHYNEITGTYFGMRITDLSLANYLCNEFDGNEWGLRLLRDNRNCDLTYNKWTDCDNALSATNDGFKKQINQSNSWFSCDTRSDGNVPFEIQLENDDSEFDPMANVTFGGTDPEPECNYTASDPNQQYPAPTTTYSEFMDDVVNSAISYPPDYEGQEYYDQWLVYEMFSLQEDLIETSVPSEDFYDNMSMTSLGELYAVYHQIKNWDELDLAILNSLNPFRSDLQYWEDSIQTLVDNMNPTYAATELPLLMDSIIPLETEIDDLKFDLDGISSDFSGYRTTKYDDLMTALSGISTSSLYDSLIKEVLTAMVYNIQYDTFTTAQAELVEDISLLCFYENGPGVLLARLYFFVEEDYDENECGAEELLSGSDDVLSNSIKLYPVPVNNTININLAEKFLGSNLQIFNSSGQVMENIRILRTHLSIPTNQWPNGLYILNVAGENKSIKFSVVK